MIVEKSNELFNHYQVIEKINELNILDEFEIRILKASILSLGQIYNPLYYSNFCLNLREILNHFIDRNTEKELILQSKWYEKPVNSNSGVTTNQKYKYLIVGNTSIEFHQSLFEMGIDIDKEIEKLTNQQKKLNKYTHFNRKSLSLTWEEAKKNSLYLLNELLNYLVLPNIITVGLQEGVSESIRDEVENFFLNNFIEKFDEIATHYFSPEPEIDNIICEFDDENLFIKIEGRVSVDFQIGSNSDQKNGLGHEFSKSFPFSANLYSELEDLKAIKAETEEWLSVDTTDFFESYYD